MRPLLVSWLLVACAGPEPEGPPVHLRIEGCEGWQRGRCLVSRPTSLLVWARPGAGDWRLKVGGQEVSLEPAIEGLFGRADAGPGDRVELWAGAGPWEVVTLAALPSEDAWAGVELPGTEEPGWEVAVRVHAEGLDDAGRAVGLERIAQVRLASGDVGAAVDAQDAAMEAWSKAGREDRWIRLATRQAWLLASEGRDLTRGRARIEQGRALVAPAIVLQAHLDWADALLAKRTGDLRRAATRYGQAVTGYRIAGVDDAATARLGQAEVEQQAGRHEVALRLLGEIAREAQAEREPPGCWWTVALNDLASAVLTARQAGYQGEVPGWPHAQPGALLAEALAAWSPDCEDGPELLRTLRLSLAQTAVVEGALELARGELAAARTLLDRADMRYVLSADLIEGALLLKSGEPARALVVFGRADDEARVVDPGTGRMEALAGLARALARLGRVDDALVRHAEAESVAAGFVDFVPLFGGRDTFLAARDDATRHRVDLLLDRGLVVEALEVVRRARAGVLASAQRARRMENLDETQRLRWEAAVSAFGKVRAVQEEGARRAWALLDEERAAWLVESARLMVEAKRTLDDAFPGGALDPSEPRRPPEPGELLLAWYRTERGWVGFAGTSAGVRAVRLGDLWPEMAPEALGAAAIGPFEDEIGASRRVTLLPWDWMRERDLHLLPWRGQTLAQRAQVVWSLDLPGRGTVADPGGPAVVVADPRGDLPGARREAEGIVPVLRGQGLRVVELNGQLATRRAVVEQLGVASLLHYAGHGASTDGWDAHLLLSDEGELTVADVLSLARVPPRVLLAGCETARTAVSRVETLGLGQAFVVAGSGAVLASTRPVDDVITARFVAALHQAGFAGGDPAAAFQEAILALSAQGADVGGFRLLVP